MTTLWPTDILTFTFYVMIWNSIPNWSFPPFYICIIYEYITISTNTHNVLQYLTVSLSLFMRNSQIAWQSEQLLNFLNWCLAEKVMKWLLCDQLRAVLSLFMSHPKITQENEPLLQKKFYELMFSLESDEITALWPNDILTLTFYVIISKSILTWTMCVK